MWTFVPVLVSLVSFSIFVLTGGVLSADVAFTSLGLPPTVLPPIPSSIYSLVQRDAIPVEHVANGTHERRRG